MQSSVSDPGSWFLEDLDLTKCEQHESDLTWILITEREILETWPADSPVDKTPNENSCLNMKIF